MSGADFGGNQQAVAKMQFRIADRMRLRGEWFRLNRQNLQSPRCVDLLQIGERKFTRMGDMHAICSPSEIAGRSANAQP